MSRLYDAVLFDFDGVLADSEPLHWSCWAEILRPLGIELDWETYRAHCIGVADLDMLNFLATLAPRPIDPASLRPYYDVKKELFGRRARDATLCPQPTVDLVGSLDGYGLAVVTSSGRREVEPVLARAGIWPCFRAAVFGEDVSRHKPAPDPYLLAARWLEARRPLVVEDSASGVESARAAGFDLIQVTSPAEVAEAVRARLSGRQKTNQ